MLPESALVFGFLAEDLIAARLLRSHTRAGFYVDVGCSDPIELSNTLLLYGGGWRGINIDANSSVVERYRAARPGDLAVHALVGLSGAERELVVFEDETRATANAEFQQRWGTELAVREVVRMAPRRLDEILDEQDVPRRIEFLNVDVEGMELEVLRSVDLDRYHFELIAAEIHDLDLGDPVSDPLVHFLRQHGYRLAAYNSLTAFFARANGGVTEPQAGAGIGT